MYRWSMGGEEGEEGGVWRGFKGFGGMRLVEGVWFGA